MENGKSRIKYGAGRYLILFFALAFVGWAFESGYITLRSGKIYNAGFLRMPFCPIYALAMLGAYLLIGTPDEGRGLLRGVANKPLRYALYLFWAFIIPSVAELAVGNLFERTIQVTLWTYEGIPLSLKYASLPVSIAWSGLLFFFMKVGFIPLKNAITKIPTGAVYIVLAILFSFVAVDLYVSVSAFL